LIRIGEHRLHIRDVLQLVGGVVHPGESDEQPQDLVRALAVRAS
jgi:hypothetical protein